MHILKHFDRFAFGALCFLLLELLTRFSLYLFSIQPGQPADYGNALPWFLWIVGSYAIGWLSDSAIGRCYRKPWGAAE